MFGKYYLTLRSFELLFWISGNTQSNNLKTEKTKNISIMRTFEERKKHGAVFLIEEPEIGTELS